MGRPKWPKKNKNQIVLDQRLLKSAPQCPSTSTPLSCCWKAAYLARKYTVYITAPATRSSCPHGETVGRRVSCWSSSSHTRISLGVRIPQNPLTELMHTCSGNIDYRGLVAKSVGMAKGVSGRPYLRVCCQDAGDRVHTPFLDTASCSLLVATPPCSLLARTCSGSA